MINVTIKPLPHSPVADSASQQMNKLVMQLIENIKSLKGQLEEAQRAIQELQRR
jgi:hypothetical protein